jgi:hypothetical protein
MRAQDLPDFKNMPAVKGMPHGTAWYVCFCDGLRIEPEKFLLNSRKSNIGAHVGAYGTRTANEITVDLSIS